MMPAMVFAADSPDSTQFTGADGVNSFNAAPDTSSGESGFGTQENSDVDADEDDLEGGNTPAKKEFVKAGYSANTTGLKGSNKMCIRDSHEPETQQPVDFSVFICKAHEMLFYSRYIVSFHRAGKSVCRTFI